MLQSSQHLTHYRRRPIDIFGSMRRRNKPGFKLRRGKIDPALQTALEKSRKHFEIATLCAGQVDNWPGREKQTEHRANSMKGGVHFQLPQRIAGGILELLAALL